jgi:hypothetical protein
MHTIVVNVIFYFTRKARLEITHQNFQVVCNFSYSNFCAKPDLIQK